MKTRSRWFGHLLIIITGLLISSCQEWGKWDPPAGNQVFPKLELIGAYAFESLEDISSELFAYEGGKIPEISYDEEHGNVLNVNGGYMRFANPFTRTKLQLGGSLTFWMKLSKANEPGALFALATEDDSSVLSVAGNGRVSFQSTTSSFQTESEESSIIDALTPEEWHYLAIVFNFNGYTIYVDGESKVGYVSDQFDFTQIKDFLMEAPYLYLAYGNNNRPEAILFDDLKLYRNIITAKEIAVPPVIPPTDENNYEFPPLNTVGYYKLDNSFTNSLRLDQNGELVTVEAQSTPSAFVEDAVRGTVWSQQEGWNGHANGWAYTRFANPMKGQRLTDGGLTLSMWINPPVINRWDQIFVLNDGTNKFWINSIGYVGYNGVGGWADCQNNNDTNQLTANEWTMVTLVMTADGFTVYYNDEVKFTDTENGSYATGAGFTDYQVALDLFTSANDFFFGYETFWHAAPALIDDLFFISRPISESELKLLYQDTKKSNGGIVENPTYIPATAAGYYKLDNTFTNEKNTSQNGELVTVEVQSTPSSFVEDAVRGTVWSQQEGWNGHANGWAYTRFANPMKGQRLTDGGLTLSMWINPPAINRWDQIFVLNDGTNKFWINSIGYVGYNGVGGWADCQNNNDTNQLTANEWTMVTLVMKADEFIVYYNDAVKFTNTENGGYATGAGFTDYQAALDLFTSASDFFFGYETFWHAAPALIDDVVLCTSPLTEKQVKTLYNGTKK